MLKIIGIVTGIVLTAAGLMLLYGDERLLLQTVGDTDIDVRDVLFSAGIALIGSGLFVLVKFIIRSP